MKKSESVSKISKNKCMNLIKVNHSYSDENSYNQIYQNTKIEKYLICKCEKHVCHFMQVFLPFYQNNLYYYIR